MRLIFLSIVAGCVGLSGVAMAEDRISDAAYWRTAQCAGLAEGTGQDARAYTVLLSRQSVGRNAFVLDRADELRREARVRAKRAKGFDAAQIVARLNGSDCSALTPRG